MSRSGPSTRIYIGHLPSGVRERDLEKLCGRYGRIRDISTKNGFGFVEFSDTRDADDAVHELNGSNYQGDRLVVELSHGTPHGTDVNRPTYYQIQRDRDERTRDRGSGGGSDRDRDRDRSYRRDSDRSYSDRDRDRHSERGRDRYDRNDRNDRDRYDGDRGGFGGGRGFGGGGGGGGRGSFPVRAPRYAPPMQTRFRLSVENLSTRCSWQDLKDMMRDINLDVTYADAHKQEKNYGIVCFGSHADAKRAIEKYQGKEINGRKIKLIDETRSDSKSASRSRSSTPTGGKDKSRGGSGKKRSATPSSRTASDDEDERSETESSHPSSDDDEPTGNNGDEAANKGKKKPSKRSGKAKKPTGRGPPPAERENGGEDGDAKSVDNGNGGAARNEARKRSRSRSASSKGSGDGHSAGSASPPLKRSAGGTGSHSGEANSPEANNDHDADGAMSRDGAASGEE